MKFNFNLMRWGSVALALICLPLAANVSLSEDWSSLVSRTRNEQPHWMSPLVTTTPLLVQQFRYDVVTSYPRFGSVTNDYGNGKGLELIPAERVEIILGVPSYLAHENTAKTTVDGFNDESLLVKYRIFSANETTGNYILTAFLGMSFGTGAKGVGTPYTTLTPTLAGGKGWGAFDIQSSISVGVTKDAETTLGNPIKFNATFQYLAAEKLWPEVEVNMTQFPNGSNSGRTQIFLTPGLVVGRLRLWREMGLSLGIGEQIAVSDYRSSNHNWITSLRIPF